MKTIKELLINQEFSESDINSGEQKIVKCPKCGKKSTLPAYMVDYVCDCAIRTDFNLDKLNDNMARTGIIRTRKRDSVFTAIPHKRTSRNRPVEET